MRKDHPQKSRDFPSTFRAVPMSDRVRDRSKMTLGDGKDGSQGPFDFGVAAPYPVPNTQTVSSRCHLVLWNREPPSRTITGD